MPRHCLVENSATFRILAEIFENGHPEGFHETSVTGSNGFQQLCPGLIQLLAVKSRVRTLAAIAAKRLSQRGKHEPSFEVLRENSNARQCSQNAIQHVAFHACLPAKLVWILGPIRKQVRNPQLGRDENRLRRPISANQLIHLSLKIHRFCHWRLILLEWKRVEISTEHDSSSSQLFLLLTERSRCIYLGNRGKH